MYTEFDEKDRSSRINRRRKTSSAGVVKISNGGKSTGHNCVIHRSKLVPSNGTRRIPSGFPESSKEFAGLARFYSHLVTLSGTRFIDVKGAVDRWARFKTSGIIN